MTTQTAQCTEVRFASFLSGGFTTMAVMNPPEKKLEKCTSVQCSGVEGYIIEDIKMAMVSVAVQTSLILNIHVLQVSVM